MIDSRYQWVWTVPALGAARLVPMRPVHRGFHVQPLWNWHWKRIGACIGLPLYTIAAFVAVGWGGPK